MRLAPAVLLLVLPLACKTSDDQPSGVILDGTELGPPTETEADDLSAVPLSLWSPAQREASAAYYFLVAESVAFKERDTKRALPIYEAAYSLDPNPFLGGKMIAAKAAAGERGEALQEARKMVLLYPQDTQLHYLYGKLLFDVGQLKQAEEEFERALEVDPTFEAAYADLLELHTLTREVDKAISVAKEMTKRIPESVVGWSTLARLHLSKGEHKQALEPARRAYELQSGNLHLVQLYAVLLQLNGETKKAVRLYEQLYRINPADEALTGRMIDLYRELGNLEDAVALVDELIRTTGQDKPSFQMQKAILLWELKRFEEASKLLASLAAEYPESDRLQYMNGLGFERLEKWDEALAAYEKVPADSSFRYHADYRVVVVLKNQKKNQEAVDLAMRLIEHEAVEWDAFALAGSLLSDEKRHREAVEVLEKGYAKFPDQPRLLFLKGVYQEKDGDIEGCIRTMRTVIEKDPANSSAYNYLGYLYAERGENLDEAEQLIKKALELKPDDGFYLDSLGWVYYQKGDLANARKHLKRALEIEPKEGVILEHLADVEKKEGRLDKARELYDKALRMELEDRDRQRIEKKFEEIRKTGG